MRKTRNSLPDSELSGSGSEDLPRFRAVEEELLSSQGSSRSANSQGDTEGTSSEELESGEGSADSSKTIPSGSENNTSLEQNDDELSEQSHKSADVGVKNKKPIPKPRRHIPRKDSNSETPKNEVNVLGVNVRETSTLKFKKFIRGPRIRVSLFDQSTGQLAKKSNSSKNVVFNKEPESLDHILPIIST